jgi:penicillin-insensitive murein endopeptidase
MLLPMSPRPWLVVLGVALAAAPARAQDRATASRGWADVGSPAPGAAEAVGGTSAGCVQGAVALPAQGPGFRLVAPERRRNFGHPALVAFVRALGKRAARAGGPLLVGDLSQPRGGPSPDGHASHQSGLDVDLWFASPRQARAEGRGLVAVPMVDVERGVITRYWRPRVLALVRAAAEDARVDRVFVHPVIKRRLCELVGNDRAWLHKVRPWWGHHRHFHVRLACPAGSRECEPQPALAPGDACDQLEWWLAPGASAEREQGRERYQSRVEGVPELPARCVGVLAAGGGPPASAASAAAAHGE